MEETLQSLQVKEELQLLARSGCQVSRVFLIPVISVKRSSQKSGNPLKCIITFMTGSCWALAVFLPSKNSTLDITYACNILLPSVRSPYFAIFQMLGAGVFETKVKRVE